MIGQDKIAEERGSVRLALRGGKSLSEKQAAMITKLAGELL